MVTIPYQVAYLAEHQSSHWKAYESSTHIQKEFKMAIFWFFSQALLFKLDIVRQKPFDLGHVLKMHIQNIPMIHLTQIIQQNLAKHTEKINGLRNITLSFWLKMCKHGTPGHNPFVNMSQNSIGVQLKKMVTHILSLISKNIPSQALQMFCYLASKEINNKYIIKISKISSTYMHLGVTS